MDLFDLAVANKLAGGGGGGGDIDVDALNVTENGVYSASSGHAFDPVTVSVPQGVFPSGTSQITSNGIYDVSNFASASVSVPGIVPSGTSAITSNGIYDVTDYASADVNVSGGGGSSDFSTATVTVIVNNPYNTVLLNIPAVIDEDDFSCSFAEWDATRSANPNIFNCILFKGKAFAIFPNVDPAVISGTGAVEIDGPELLIMGNCTITIG